MKQEIIIYKRISRQFPEMAAGFIEDFSYYGHICYSMELYEMTLF